MKSLPRASKKPVIPPAALVVTCSQTGKLRFVSRRLAKRNARKQSMRGVTAYRCHSCKGWHVGHSTAEGRAMLREAGL